MTIAFDQSIRFPLAQRGDLPKTAGLYIATQGDVFLYIGVAANFRSRWKHHHRLPELESLEDVVICCFEMAHSDAVTLERQLIKTLKPSMNDLIDWSQHPVIPALDSDTLPNLPLWEQPGFVPLSSSLKPDEATAREECLLAFPHIVEVRRDIWAAMARRQGYELVAVESDGNGGLNFYGRPIKSHDQYNQPITPAAPMPEGAAKGRQP